MFNNINGVLRRRQAKLIREFTIHDANVYDVVMKALVLLPKKKKLNRLKYELWYKKNNTKSDDILTILQSHCQTNEYSLKPWVYKMIFGVPF